MIIELPYPPRILSQNARVNFRAKAVAVKGYRLACRKAVEVLNKDQFDGCKKINMTLIFHSDGFNELDDDNLIGMFKSGRDGLADGLGVNDVRFKIKGVEQLLGQDCRKVVVTLWAGDE